MTHWATRQKERDRFRSADGRVDRSVMMMAGSSRRTVALTDGLDSSPHWGPGRSPVSGDLPSRVTQTFPAPEYAERFIRASAPFSPSPSVQP